jgi:hypothetical protein
VRCLFFLFFAFRVSFASRENASHASRRAARGSK